MKNVGRAEGQHPLNNNYPLKEAGSREEETGMKPGFSSQPAIGLPVVREFERLPKEGMKAYAAFKAYLDLGPERSLEMVGRKLGKSKVLMERWSRRYDWTGRVLAHGAYVAEVERAAIERVAVEKAVEWARLMEPLKRESWRQAELAIAQVREARERWMETDRVPGFEGMARMLELAFKLKQFAVGLTPELRQREEATTVQVDVCVALEKIYGKPLAGEIGTTGQRDNGTTGLEPAKIGDGEVVSLVTSAATKDPAKEGV